MGRRRRHDTHLPKRMYERRGKFYFDCPLKGKWVPLGGDMAVAFAEYGRLIGPAWSGRTIGDTIERYKIMVTPMPKRGRPRTKKAVNGENAMLDRLKGVFGLMLQDNVTHPHLYKYLETRQDTRETFKGKNRAAPRAAFNEIQLLGQVFTKGIRWGAGTINPVSTLTFDEDELARYKPKRDRYVTDEEFAAVHALANPRMRLAMELARNIGQRRGDLLKIRREHLTQEGILVEQGKGGALVLVEWTAALKSITDRLQALSPDIPRDYLIRKRNGRPYTPDGFTAIWQRLIAKAMKPGKNAEPPAIQSRFTFHDLRAKAATDSEEDTEAQKLLGHTNVQTTRRHYIRRRKPTRARPVQ